MFVLLCFIVIKVSMSTCQRKVSMFDPFVLKKKEVVREPFSP